MAGEDADELLEDEWGMVREDPSRVRRLRHAHRRFPLLPDGPEHALADEAEAVGEVTGLPPVAALLAGVLVAPVLEGEVDPRIVEQVVAGDGDVLAHGGMVPGSREDGKPGAPGAC